MRLGGLSFALALAGLLYEFVWAHTMSVFFGQAAVQYALTLALFMLGMGLGSAAAEHIDRKRWTLARLQWLLALLTPIGFTFFGWLVEWQTPTVAQAWALLMILGTGALTGLELPLLFHLAPTQKSIVLAADYFGMLVASLLFPFLLLPHLGLQQTLWVAAIANGVCALMSSHLPLQGRAL